MREPARPTYSQPSAMNMGQPPPSYRQDAPRANGSSPQASGGTAQSILGADIGVAGQHVVIVTRSSLLVAGTIYGDINGDEIVISDTGSVNGSITARAIVIHGHVAGALKASSITLTSSARVQGDIVKEVLIINEGAHFDGSVRRAKDASEVAPNLNIPVQR